MKDETFIETSRFLKNLKGREPGDRDAIVMKLRFASFFIPQP